MSRERGTGVALAFMAALAAVAFAGCGRDDFNGDPKPPAPLEATIAISPEQVEVSPRGFGAGLVNFVIANNSDQRAAVTISGPVDQTSSPIPVNANGVLRVEMKTGDYRVSVDGREPIKPARFTVGPERPPSNNDLLLP